MVTQARLSGILDRVTFFDIPDRAELERELWTLIEATLPDVDVSQDPILERLIGPFTQQMVIWMLRNNAEHRQSLVAFSEGPYLDQLTLGPPPVLRRSGEADDSLRLEYINAHARLNLGSLQGIEQQAREFNSLITDAYAVTAPNPTFAAVYSTKGRRDPPGTGTAVELAQLTMDEQTELSVELNQRDTKIGGSIIRVEEPVIKEFFLHVTATYDGLLHAEADVLTDLRNAIYAFLDNAEKIARDIYESSIRGATYLPEVVASWTEIFVGDHNSTTVVGDLFRRQGQAWPDRVQQGVAYVSVFPGSAANGDGLVISTVDAGAPPENSTDTDGNAVTTTALGDYWFHLGGNGWQRRAQGVHIVTSEAIPDRGDGLYLFQQAGIGLHNPDNRVMDDIESIPHIPALQARKTFEFSDVWRCDRDDVHVKIYLRNIRNR